MYNLLTVNDPRWQQLAEVFCQATKLKPGDKVVIQAQDLEALPLLFALYKEALLRGAATVDYTIGLPDLGRFFLDHASEEQLKTVSAWHLRMAEEADIFMNVSARTNALHLRGVPGVRLATRQLATKPISDRRLTKRWCLTDVPTDNDALLAGMPTPEYRDFFFRAVLQDYAAMERNHRALKHLMEQTDRVHIVGLDTDINFSIKGIPVISCHGEFNLPDGEVFTAPVRDSINGYIRFNTPSVYMGDEWSGVRLTFAHGRITDATCDQGADKINQLLDTDEGSRYTGEFAIGTNKGITRPAKSILFDEKIIGSFHLTPGRCYDDASNGNQSANHWDLVKILTPEYGGGRIEFDGVPIMIDGKFVHPELLPLNP